jgi:DNA repair exonuclease SbcCD ATPase subunit
MVASSSLDDRHGVGIGPFGVSRLETPNGFKRRDAMPPQVLVSRVERLEERVTALEQLPARLDDLTQQVVQLRTGMGAEFSAVRDEMRGLEGRLREEMRAGHEELRQEMRTEHEELRQEMRTANEQLRQEMRAGHEELRQDMRAGHAELRQEMLRLNEDTQHQMRVLHEDVVGKIALLDEGRRARAPRRKRPKKS